MCLPLLSGEQKQSAVHAAVSLGDEYVFAYYVLITPSSSWPLVHFLRMRESGADSAVFSGIYRITRVRCS
jgi:hypothetical protein